MADRNSTRPQPQARPVYFRATSGAEGSFSDNRVFLIQPDEFDKVDPTCCRARQDMDGPTLLTIGPCAPDSSLVNASRLYGIPVAHLHEFRAKMKKQVKGVKARSAAKIKVTSTGTPPLTGAEAFARLIVAKEDKRLN